MIKIWKLISLIILDQSVKCVVHFFFMKQRYVLKVIGFTPLLNKNQLSLFNHELSMNRMKLLIIINILAIAVVIALPYILKRKKECHKSLNLLCLLLLAGSICSLIDKLVYGGSIDYILFYNHVYDIKDLYLFGAVIPMLFWVYDENIKPILIKYRN